jgi:hypothetical protein
MRKAIIAAALTFLGTLWPLADALATGAGAGYFFPNPANGNTCGTSGGVCDGVRATFIAPTPIYAGTNGEAQDSAFIYVAIFGSPSGHGAQCTFGAGGNNPLLQFGVEAFILANNAISYTTWWEAFPCNHVTSFGSLVVNPGDQITLELLCIANCTTGNVNANWQMTWKNDSTGLSQSRTDTGSWTVYMDFAQVAVEQTGTGVDDAGGQPLHFTTPVQVWNVQVHQVGVGWIPMAVLGESPAARITSDTRQIKSSPKTYETYYSSTAIDSDGGPSFKVCDNITQASSTPVIACPNSTYGGTFGLGPFW